MNAARRIALLVLLATPAVAAPRDATERYKYGQQLFDKKRYAAAVRAFQRALASGGDRVMLFDLARAQQAAGMNQEAIASYQAFLDAAPMSPLRFDARRGLKEARARLRAEGASARTSGVAKTAAAATAATTSAPAAAKAESPPARATNYIRPGGVTTAAEATRPATATTASRPATAATPGRPSARSAAAVPRPRLALVPQPAPPTDEVAPAVTTPRAVAADGLQRVAAGVLFGGAAVLGGGIGCLAASAIRSNEVDQAVRFDPAVDASGQRFQAAGSVLTVVGVVALLVGSELVRRHMAADEERRAGAAAAAGERTWKQQATSDAPPSPVATAAVPGVP